MFKPPSRRPAPDPRGLFLNDSRNTDFFSWIEEASSTPERFKLIFRVECLAVKHWIDSSEGGAKP